MIATSLPVRSTVRSVMATQYPSPRARRSPRQVSLPPGVEITAVDVLHGPHQGHELRGVQPAGVVTRQLPRLRLRAVHVGHRPGHRAQKLSFVAARQPGELDPYDVGGEVPHLPRLHPGRPGRPVHGLLHQRVEIARAWRVVDVPRRPDRGAGAELLGLARVRGTVRGRTDARGPAVAERAGAGVVLVPGRRPAGLGHARGRLGHPGGHACGLSLGQACVEALRVLELGDQRREVGGPGAGAVGGRTRLRPGVPRQQLRAHLVPVEVEVRRQEGRGRQPQQVEQPWAGGQLVEVVDAPAPYLLAVAPGAEVLDVQVADDRHRRARVDRGQLLGPPDQPQVVGAAQELQLAGRERSVLLLEPRWDQLDDAGQPPLEVPGEGTDPVAHAISSPAGAGASTSPARTARLPPATAAARVSRAPRTRAEASPGSSRPSWPPMVAAATGTPSWAAGSMASDPGSPSRRATRRTATAPTPRQTPSPIIPGWLPSARIWSEAPSHTKKIAPNSPSVTANSCLATRRGSPTAETASPTTKPASMIETC